jgi:hypothetical protein
MTVPSDPPSGDAEAPLAGMTDLSETLRGPDGAAEAARLLERFDAIVNELTRDMMSGTTPDRFRSMDTIRTAVFHAKNVLVAFNKSNLTSGSGARRG